MPHQMICSSHINIARSTLVLSSILDLMILRIIKMYSWSPDPMDVVKPPNTTNLLSVKWTPHPISNFDGYKYTRIIENTNTAVIIYRWI